jgi:cell division protein FtsB
MKDAKRATADEPATHGAVARQSRRILRYVLAFVAAILLVDAIVGEKGLLSLVKARRDFANVERALQQARRENAELREQARRLREDPSAIEEVARRELGLIKPGEKLFIVRDAATKK